MKGLKTTILDLRSEAGATLVEAAVVVPLIITLLLGMVQYGLIFGGYLTLQHAAAVASRAVYSGNVEAAARAAVTPYLQSAQLTTSAVTSNVVVTLSDGTSQVLPVTNLTLDYNFPVYFKLVVPGTSSDGTIRLRSQATVY